MGGCANTDMPMYIRIGKEHLRCKSVLESQGKPGPVPWSFTPLGLWVRKIATMSYEMSRQRSALTEAHRMDRKKLL